MADIVCTPPGMLSFPHLFEAKAAAPGGEPRFSFVLVFDKTQQALPEYKALKLAVADAIDRKWGNGKSKDPDFVRKLRLPFRDAGDKTKYDGYEEGFRFISAQSKKQRKVLLADATTQLTSEADVYGGQEARAWVSAFAYDTSGNKGVSFWYDSVQITKRNNPRRDGHQDPSSYMPAVDDPTANLTPAGLPAAAGVNGASAPGPDPDDDGGLF